MSQPVKPHRNVRAAMKWGGPVVTAALVVAWIGSGWYCLMWESPAGGYIAVQAGQLGIAEPLWMAGANGRGVWWFEPLDVPLEWWFRWGHWNGGRDVAAPLWLPALAALLVTIAAWRADARVRRQQREGRCHACTYDLAGLPTQAVCPECGQRVDRAARGLPPAGAGGRE